MDRKQQEAQRGAEHLDRRTASSSTTTINESRPSSTDLDSGVRTPTDNDRLLQQTNQQHQTVPSAPSQPRQLVRQNSIPLRAQQSSISGDIFATGNGKQANNKQLLKSREELPIVRKATSNSRLDRQNKTIKKTLSTDSGRPPSFNSALRPPGEHHSNNTKFVQLAHIDWQYNPEKLDQFGNNNPENGHWDSYNESKIAYFMPSSAVVGERQYPKTRLAHLVLKSIVYFLCAMLLLLTLISAIMATIKLPKALEKFPTTHQFNVTIATG